MQIFKKLLQPKFLSLLLITLLLISSCKKIDNNFDTKDNRINKAEITQKFFALPANASVAVVRLAEAMKALNNKEEFVTNFVEKNGYPLWNKALINDNKIANKNTSSSNITNAEGDTLVILPVAESGIEYVNSFIYSKINGNVDLKLFRGGDYNLYSFDNAPAFGIEADRAAFQIMLLNKQVYGYKEFIINDNRLFSNENIYNPNERKKRIIFKDTLDIANPEIIFASLKSYLVAPCASISFITEYPDNTYMVTIWTFCPDGSLTIYQGWGGGSSGGNGGTGGTGGGPSGGTTSGGSGGGDGGGPFPCPSGQGGNFGAPLCNTTPPAPVTPMPSPCAKVATLFATPNVKDDYTYLKSLANGPHEKAYSFLPDGTSYFSMPSTKKHEVTYRMPTQGCIGYVHCHDDESDGKHVYSMFTLKDLEDIYEHYTNQYIKAETATIGVITPNGTTYILTIQDPSAFQTFFQSFMENNTEKQRDREYDAYVNKNTQPGVDSEKGLLQFIKDKNMGCSLIKTNDDYTEFTELKLNANGSQVIPTSCDPA